MAVQDFAAGSPNTPGMSDPVSSSPSLRSEHESWLHRLSPEDRRALLHRVTARQARLSLSVGGVFLVALLAIPLVNTGFPEMVSRPVAGFPLGWLVLGVLFYPLTWVLSWIFIRKSNELEDAIARDESGRALEDNR